MNYRWLYFIACIIIISSCRYGYKEEHPYDLAIVNYGLLDSIPSASAIALVKDSAYVIGDDAGNIYKISLDTWNYRKIPIPGARTDVRRIPKDTKHDYEAAAIGTINENVYLLAFGSGTLAPYRDSVLFFNINNEAEIKKTSLTSFYAAILQKGKIDKKDFNIEGATIAGNFLYLFNRANGLIFQVNWPGFFEYINDSAGKTVPELYTHKIELPKDNEVQAGFSGASTLDKNKIVFTASLEDTKNWVDDGEIKGSYIGILDIVSPQELRLYAGVAVKDSTRSIGIEQSKIKLESVDVISNSPESITLEAVADNDDGTSAFYRIRLDKK